MTKNHQKEASSRLLETISAFYADPAVPSTVLRKDYSVRGRGTRLLVPLPLTERSAVLTRMCLQATLPRGSGKSVHGTSQIGSAAPCVPARRCVIVRVQR